MAADTQLPVTVSDLEVAQRIAGAARSGRRADREPPLEQLLGAFGETEPSAEARARVASALTLAGLRTRPTVHEAHPGERVKLMVPGGGPNLRLIAAAIALVPALGATALG